MSTDDFLRGAPRFITRRFNSIKGYVRNTLYPEEVRQQIFKHLKSREERQEKNRQIKELTNEATLVTFLFLLRKFFAEGATAAKKAVDSLQELGVEGFFIGTDYFSERNPKVIQGDLLAEKLVASIEDPELRTLILDSQYVSEILQKYRNKV